MVLVLILIFSLTLTFLLYLLLVPSPIITITRRGTKHTTRPHTPKGVPLTTTGISVSVPKGTSGCSSGCGGGALVGACTPSLSGVGPHPLPVVSVSGPKGSRGCSDEGEDKPRTGGSSGRDKTGDAGSPALGEKGSPKRTNNGVGATTTEPKRTRIFEGTPKPLNILVISRSPAVALPTPLGPPTSYKPK